MDRPQTSPTTRNIRILQANCGKNTNAMHSCLETAVKTADIVLIQEPRVGAWNSEKGSFTMVEHPAFTCLIPPGHNNNQITPRV